jgi:hypothetical protein
MFATHGMWRSPMSGSDCPSQHDLHAYLVGKLFGQAAERLAEHLVVHFTNDVRVSEHGVV